MPDSVRLRRLSWTSDAVSLGELPQLLRTEAYEQTRGRGFIVDTATRKEVQGRYLERRAWQEKVEGPYGEETTISRIAYTETAFTIYADHFWLTNPPPSFRKLIQRVSELTKFRIAVSEDRFDLTLVLNGLASAVGPMEVSSCVFSNIALGKQTVGAFTVRGEQSFKHGNDFLEDRSRRIDKIKVDFRTSDLLSRVTASYSGAIGLTGPGASDPSTLRLAEDVFRPAVVTQ